MNKLCELPRRLVAALKTIGPIHTAATADYVYEIRLIVADENEPVGFLIEQRLADPGDAPVASTEGLAFKVPARPQPGGEATWVYAESLSEAMEYISR